MSKENKLPKTGEEIEALRISFALTGIAVDSKTTCLILEVFKAVQQKGGKFSIEDAIRIQYEVERKYKVLKVEATPNS